MNVCMCASVMYASPVCMYFEYRKKKHYSEFLYESKIITFSIT